MHGNNIRNGAPACVALSKHSTACAAVSDGDNQLRARDCVVRALQSLFHVYRYGACNQQQIGVPRACNEFDPDALEVVVGIVERLDLQLAPITRAGIDMSNTERTAQDLQQVFLKRFDGGNLFERNLRSLRQYPRPNHTSENVKHSYLIRPVRCRTG